MSLLFTGSVAITYAAGVIGMHRFNVSRLRRQAGQYPTLKLIDWQTLFDRLVPPESDVEAVARKTPLLQALSEGVSIEPKAFEDAGFSGGEIRWLGMISDMRRNPERALGAFQNVDPATVAEAYLREELILTNVATPVNLELVVFASKRRITAALGRFTEHPALYFVRAKASALLGFNGSVLDDLARAVYFSRQAPFYRRVITEWSYVQDARPALWKACQSETRT